MAVFYLGLRLKKELLALEAIPITVADWFLIKCHFLAMFLFIIFTKLQGQESSTLFVILT